jgi:S1-C subfamily serine protease
VGTDPTADIAVLQLTGASGLQPIKTGDSSKVAPGDSVIAIGNAGGTGGTPSVVSGSVEAVDQTITASDQGGGNAEQLSGLLEINAPIEAGDSGGPLVAASGDTIGINTAASASNRFDAAASVAYAIPIDEALAVAQQIRSGQPSSTVHIGLPGFLGVAVQDPGAGSVGGFGNGFGGGATNATAGAVVGQVESGSPAASIGLAVGDVITTVDGKAVASAAALTTVMRTHHPHDHVTIGWTDQAGQSHSATATLVTGPAD